MKNQFLVAQLGARRHYAIPRMLQDAGLLDCFYTDICAVKGWPRLLDWTPHAWQPKGLRRLLGRVPTGVPVEKINALTSLGWAYKKEQQARSNDPEQAAAVHITFGAKFCEAILLHGLGKATATYTFNSAGLELMRTAKKIGLKTVMEQTSAPRAVELEILAEAGRRYPDWAKSVPAGANIDAFIAREEKEWQFADIILCGSEFVRNGIARRGGPVNKCQVVPYGVDDRFLINRGPRKSGPLRVLTVGQVRLQKGAPVVWEAAKLLGKHASFRMVGSVVLPPNVASKMPENISLTGAVPRSEIIEHYQWADVFLLPSLCEGSATVTYEAMLAGLPVLCTPNTGSAVVDGVSGRIVPIFSPESIAAALQEWIEKPELFIYQRENAVRQTPQLGIDAYRNRLVAQLNSL